MLPFKLVLFLFYFIVLCSPRIRAESATCSEEERLYDAAKEGRPEEVKTLLAAGADPEYKDYGNTALHIASKNGHEDCVKNLIAGGADVQAPGVGELTALHWASMRGHHKVVQILLEAKASVESKGYGGETPLHLASKYGHIEAIHFLLRHGARKDVRDKYFDSSIDKAPNDAVVNALHERIRL